MNDLSQANEAVMLLLRAQLVAAVEAERAAVAALPEVLPLEIEFAALDAISAPVSALIERIVSFRPETVRGRAVRKYALRVLDGQARAA